MHIKKEVFSTLVKAFHESSSNPSVSADKAMSTLDNDMRDEVDDIDFDELKDVVDASDDPKLREYYLTMKQLKRDFDDEREDRF